MSVPASLLAGTAFTSQGEIEAVLTTLGVDLRTQDNPDAMSYAISFGTSRVLMKVKAAGSVAELAASPWTRLAATIAAAVFVTAAGGEPVPGSIAALWEEVSADLAEIHKGEATVPDIVRPVAYGTGPVAVNIRVDLQRARIVRRVGSSSTDTPADYHPPTDYLMALRSYGWMS